MANIPTGVNKDLLLREKLAIQRTYMASQSTFLSFLRTSLYFLVAGLTIQNLLNREGDLMIEILFYSISGFLLVIGIANYIIQNRKIKESERHVGDYQFEYLDTK